MHEGLDHGKRDIFVLDDAFGLVGRLDGVHVDPDGDAWGTVQCGTFGARARLVPLRGAHWWSGYLRIPCSRSQVRSAPESRAQVLLDDRDAFALRSHYTSPHEDDARFHRP
jgi:hypothetical protein